MKNKYTFLSLAVLLSIATACFAQQWQTWNTANSQLPGDTVNFITIDPSGNIWLSMSVAGDFGKLNGTSWTDFYDSVGRGYPVQSYYFGGILWVAGGQVTKYDGNTWAAFSIPNDDGADIFTSDNQGQFWAAGSGVDVLRTNGRWNHFDAAQPATNFPDNSIQTIATDNNGNAWVSFIYDGGVVKLNSTTGQGKYISASDSVYANIPSKDVCSVAVDWGGNVWCATRGTTNPGEGVYKINADGSGAHVWSTDSSFDWISNDVRAVAVDHCGHVWIGTDAGAAMYDGATWTIHNTANSPLPSDSVNSIYVDAGGHIWFCTDQGLAEYKPLPDAVYPNYPANNAMIQADSVTCFWAWGCPNVSRFYFEYADNAQFNNSTVDTTLTSFTTGTPGKLLTNLKNNTTYYWRVKAENDAGYGAFSPTQQFSVNITAVPEPVPGSADGFSLQQNYPNPFGEATTIRFTVPQREYVSLAIYDALGRRVATLAQGMMERGAYAAPFRAPALLRNGVYFYRLQSGSTQIQRAMQVLR